MHNCNSESNCYRPTNLYQVLSVNQVVIVKMCLSYKTLRRRRLRRGDVLASTLGNDVLDKRSTSDKCSSVITRPRTNLNDTLGNLTKSHSTLIERINDYSEAREECPSNSNRDPSSKVFDTIDMCRAEERKGNKKNEDDELGPYD